MASFRVKKRLHDMLRSNEAPENENFVERLIPTGSISMKNTLRGLEVRGSDSLNIKNVSKMSAPSDHFFI